MRQLLILSALIAFASPSALAQSGGTSQDSTAYCDSLCRVPLPERIIPADPPFMCDCMVIIGGGVSSGGSSEPLTAPEILDRMFADNERRVANVDNYTTVMTTSSAPMPVVLYYEKEIIDGRSTFQLISPAELADREAAANGQPTSEQMGEGVVALADALGGLLGGGTTEDPGDSSAGGESSRGGTQSSANGDGGSGNGGSGNGGSGGVLGGIIDGIRDFGEGLREGRGRFEEQQGVVDDLFWNQELAERAFNAGKQEVLIDGEYYSCDVLSADWRHLQDFDLGPGYEDYRLGSARLWLSDEEEGFYEPIAMWANIYTPTGENITIYRTHKDFRQDTPGGPIVPRRTKMTMDGIAGLVQGAVDNVWTELQTIMDVFVNDGPPTAEQSAQMISDAMERLGLN